MWNSYPSKSRRTSAFLIIVIVLSIGVVLKAVRDFGILPFLLFLDVKGTSPNFVIPFCVPIGILLLNKEVTLWDFIKGALGAALGLTTYEIMQIWMPWLTFDYYDILASFIGGMMSIFVAWIAYFRPRKINLNIDTEHQGAIDADARRD
jgi:hypothetical protein